MSFGYELCDHKNAVKVPLFVGEYYLVAFNWKWYLGLLLLTLSRIGILIATFLL